jgi:hypothetical protein
MGNATGKLSNMSPTDTAWPAESTSLVITFRQAAGAPLGMITSVYFSKNRQQAFTLDGLGQGIRQRPSAGKRLPSLRM